MCSKTSAVSRGQGRAPERARPGPCRAVRGVRARGTERSPHRTRSAARTRAGPIAIPRTAATAPGRGGDRSAGDAARLRRTGAQSRPHQIGIPAHETSRRQVPQCQSRPRRQENGRRDPGHQRPAGGFPGGSDLAEEQRGRRLVAAGRRLRGWPLGTPSTQWPSPLWEGQALRGDGAVPLVRVCQQNVAVAERLDRPKSSTSRAGSALWRASSTIRSTRSRPRREGRRVGGAAGPWSC